MKPGVKKENHPETDTPTISTKDAKQLPLPQAKVASAPLKSILKNLSVAPLSAYMPPAVEPPLEPPNGPVASPAYFMSPVVTILESAGPGADDISLHDLTEAYNTVSNRIRSQIRPITADQAPKPALVSLQEYAHQLAEALRRDLKRARDDPLFYTRRTVSAEDPFQMYFQVDEEETRVSCDLASLSQQVLRLISQIFSFSPLYSIFSTNDLQSVLNELLALGAASFLPSPASGRTWTLVVWILSVQNLPSAVLLPAKRQIVSVLKRAIEGEIGKDQAKLDALKASGHLLKQFPRLFLSPLSEIFPCILEHIVADSSDFRLQAVNLLGRFAFAKINTLHTAQPAHVILREALAPFIKSQTSRSQSVQPQPRLQILVSSAISANTPANPADGPFWVVQLLASLVILVDSSIFSTPRLLKLVGESIGQLGRHKQIAVSALHPYLWKCLIWAFSRLPQDDEDSPRESAYRILIQDLRGDTGVALVLSLLGPTPGDPTQETSDSVSKVLEVVKDMMASSTNSVQADGIALLTKLLYTKAPSAASVSPPGSMLVPQLFDGSFLGTDKNTIKSTVRSLSHLDTNQVRQLSDSEMLHHWDGLADLWQQATTIALRPDLDTNASQSPTAECTENLLHSWQSLLLTPSDLTQGFAHLATPAPFSDKITTLLCSFIAPAETALAQLARLRLVTGMWRTMTNVFQPDRLAAPAETVLAAVQKQRYDLADEQVRDVWTAFCSELMALARPGSVDVAEDQGEARMPEEIQRQLWISSVKSSHNGASWRDVAHLLSVPLGAWTMIASDLEIWEKLLRVALASDRSIRPTVVVECALENVKDGRRCSGSLEEFLTLLSYFDLEGKTSLPKRVLNVVDQVLDALYPTQVLAPTSLQLLRRLRDIFLSAPSSLALPLLLALENSLCKWLEDDQNALAGAPREEVARCLYSAPLSAIQDLEPTIETLNTISRFLVTTADPDAFQTFWRATYHERHELCDRYPDNVKTCLQAFSDVFGGSLAAELPREEHSQMENSCALDSQPPSSLEYHADQSRFPLEADATGMDDTRIMDHENSASTVCGPAETSVRELAPPPQAQSRPVLSALEQLQEYSSRVDESSVGDLSSRQDRANSSSQSAATVRGHDRLSLFYSTNENTRLKRRNEADDTSASKRRRTNPSSDRSEHNAIAGPSRPTGQSISEPVSRRDSVVLSEHAISQPSPSRKRKGKRRMILDYVEVPTLQESQRRREERSLPTPSPSFRQQPIPRPTSPAEEEEDYGSWEASLSISDLKEVQNSLGHKTESPSPDDNAEQTADMEELHAQVSHSTSRSRRTASAPVPHTTREPLPLRRNKTSSRLEALQQAYQAVTTAESQIPIQDLIQANSLVHKIGAALNEQMDRRMNRPP